MEPNTLTPEQQADIKARTDAFQADVQELQTRHQIAISPFPHLAPDPKTPGAFLTLALVQLNDTKYAAVPSPVQPVSDDVILD